MKKTIITLLALCGVASAADLVAKWDGFSSLTSGDYTFATSGSTTVSSDGILNVVGASGGTATVDITNAGLNFTNGFTLNMLVNSVGSYGGNGPYSLVGFRGATTEFLTIACIASDNSGKFCFSGSVNNITTTSESNASLETITGTSAYSAITLTFTSTEFKMYLNGNLVATGTPNSGKMTTAMATETITKIALGSWAGASSSSRLSENVAAFAIYDGAMTATEVAALVPEPTTATLSLLALCGLAARRRRR